MKKIIVFLATFLMFGALAYAVDTDVWLSSNTATADSNAVLCGQYIVGASTVNFHAVLHEVVVSTPSAGGITIFGSSFTTTASSIGPITTGGISQASAFYVPYDVNLSTSMMYTKTGTAQVQILYQCL